MSRGGGPMASELKDRLTDLADHTPPARPRQISGAEAYAAAGGTRRPRPRWSWCSCS